MLCCVLLISNHHIVIYTFFLPSIVCAIGVQKHRDTQETLAVLDRLDLDTDKPSDEELARKFGYEEAYYSGNLSWWHKTKPKIWSLFDEPYSSNSAKVTSSTYNISFSILFPPILDWCTLVVDVYIRPQNLT